MEIPKLTETGKRLLADMKKANSHKDDEHKVSFSGKEIRALIQCVYVAKSHSIDRKHMPVNNQRGYIDPKDMQKVLYGDLVKKLIKMEVDLIIKNSKLNRTVDAPKTL